MACATVQDDCLSIGSERVTRRDSRRDSRNFSRARDFTVPFSKPRQGGVSPRRSVGEGRGVNAVGRIIDLKL